MIVIVQNRDRIFRVVLDVLDTVIDLLRSIHIRVGCLDQIIQRLSLTGNDQCSQLDRTIEFFFFIHDIDRGDIVIIGRLAHKSTHRILDRHRLGDADIVRRHT